MTTTDEAKQSFTIFRAKDARGLMESRAMTLAPMTDTQIEGFKKMAANGVAEGEEVKILVNLPGFSLTYAWVKKDYPLTLHSHDSDCLYYVVAGSLKLGTETLEARDSLFVPANVPYTYRAGADGAEVLEFRHETNFNFRNLSKGEAFYTKGAETCAANLEDWRSAKRPSELA